MRQLGANAKNFSSLPLAAGRYAGPGRRWPLELEGRDTAPSRDMADYLLFENATGYALFDVVEAEDIGANLEKVQESVLELNRFGKMVKLKAFVPFKSAEEALANINDVTEGASPPAPPPLRRAATPPRPLL